MLIWVGSQAPAEFVRDVFGTPSPQQIDTRVCSLPQLDNPTNAAVRKVLDDAVRERRRAMRLEIVHQYDKREALFRRQLIEDAGLDGAAGYLQLLMETHKRVQGML
ncbi:hypothetical protein MSG28_011613 [Choristoneura fumiferana]|uniref:Uncharacterized protein n=3 Tax=Choristoneura fumiferana TaxID=7141 RepID=A0ACC0JP19_CHOFU|nr:hypothetical protein MSG28_011610 [Choristoneura fumiferana]KAI8425848.1 hypothetical protein MSG28_011613 [Choristoneura fumiferana]